MSNITCNFSHILKFLNDNSQLLLAIETGIYVWATCRILKANKKSANLAEKQLDESKKQIRKSIDLELYEKRKSILMEIDESCLASSSFEVYFLFDDEIYEKYMDFAKIYMEYRMRIDIIGEYERALKSEDMEHGTCLIRDYYNLLGHDNSEEDNERLLKFCDDNPQGYEDEDGWKSINYRQIDYERKRLRDTYNSAKRDLIDNMKKFVKKSVLIDE